MNRVLENIIEGFEQTENRYRNMRPITRDENEIHKKSFCDVKVMLYKIEDKKKF